MLPWFWLFGGEVTDSGFTTASGYLDSAASISAMQKLQELHKAGIFTVRDIDGTPDAWQAIKEKGIALFLEGSWFFSANPDYKDLQIVPSIIPTVNGKSSSILGGENIVMFSTTQKKDAAWKFMQFMLSPEIQQRLMEVNLMPVVKSLSQTGGDNEVWDVYMKQLESAKSRIPHPEYSTISQLLKDCFTSIMNGTEEAEVALKKAAPLIDGELKK
jgi:multiple sugar transport system substrate-binding protein